MAGFRLWVILILAVDVCECGAYKFRHLLNSRFVWQCAWDIIWVLCARTDTRIYIYVCVYVCI